MTSGGPVFEPDRTRPAPTLPAPLPDASDSSGESLSARVGLGTMVRAGGHALRRFPGLVGSIYLVQLVLSAGAAFLMAWLLVSAFANRPLFDDAMAGDLAALVSSFQRRPDLLPALVAIGAGAALLYGMLSWLLSAGLIAVLLDPPSRRREVARWFGAGAVANFFPFVRLAAWSLLPHALWLVPVQRGLAPILGAATALREPNDLILALSVACLPVVVIYWVVSTAVDYARIDLVRHPGMSAIRALLRGFRLIARRRRALVHSFGYGVLFAAMTALYAAVSGRLLAGLVALVVARQLTSILRFAAHVALIAGQVELACAEMSPPLGKRRG
jgi:hypothetical protein